MRNLYSFPVTAPIYIPTNSELRLLLSRVSRVRLCPTPQTAAHQAPPPLGFSRQEHWHGLPFPSPVHESDVKGKSPSRVRLLATPWTAAHQAPPSMGFSRQEYWRGVPLPSPNSELGFSFLHLLTSVCYCGLLVDSRPDRREVLPRCGFFSQLSVFLSSHWPSVCCLRGNVYSGVIPIF